MGKITVESLLKWVEKLDNTDNDEFEGHLKLVIYADYSGHFEDMDGQIDDSSFVGVEEAAEWLADKLNDHDAAYYEAVDLETEVSPTVKDLADALTRYDNTPLQETFAHAQVRASGAVIIKDGKTVPNTIMVNTSAADAIEWLNDRVTEYQVKAEAERLAALKDWRITVEMKPFIFAAGNVNIPATISLVYEVKNMGKEAAISFAKSKADPAFTTYKITDVQAISLN